MTEKEKLRDDRRAWLSRASYHNDLRRVDPSLGVAIRAELEASERDMRDCEKMMHVLVEVEGLDCECTIEDSLCPICQTKLILADVCSDE